MRRTAMPLFIKLMKIACILFVWIGLNFIYGFADYSQPRPPYPDVSYWGYYGFTALYSSLFCYLLYRHEREPQFSLAWKWLCVSFLVWFAWQLYAAFFGVSINEKYISSTLFYFNSIVFCIVMLWHPFKGLVRWVKQRAAEVHGIEDEDLGL